MNQTEFQALQSDTYIYAVVVMFFAFAIAFIIATLINYKGTEDTSFKKRRVWYYVIMAISALGFWLYNDNVIKPKIDNLVSQNQFSKTNIQCLVIIVLGYLVLGIIVAASFKKSKFHTVFFKHSKN